MAVRNTLPLLALVACTATVAGTLLLNNSAGAPPVAVTPAPTSMVPVGPAFAMPTPAPPRRVYATPTIACCASTETTITLTVCAGVTSGNIIGGAPAGFSVQWMPLPDVDGDGDKDADDCAAFVWPVYTDGPPETFCKGSFSGSPACSAYNLAAGACTPCPGSDPPSADGTVRIGALFDDECGVGVNICGGEELGCGTTYVFRGFVHATSGVQRSAYTGNVCCSTAACPGGCMLSQGFWRNKICNNVGMCTTAPTLPALPACACSGDNSAGTGLCLFDADCSGNGADCYGAAAICTVLNTSFAGPPSTTNTLGKLAHQVISVELSFLASGCGGSVPGPGDGGIGDALAAAHARLAACDVTTVPTAATLTSTLSTFIEDNHITTEPGCP